MRPAKSILLVLSFFWNAPIVLSQPVPDNPEKQMQEVMKTVKLSAEQKEKVKDIRQSGRAELQNLRDELEKQRRELNQRLDANAADANVRQAFQNLQETKRALEKARFERMLAIRSVLSETQKAAFQNLRQQSARTYSLRDTPESRRE